ncbi:MAG: PEP-CTERM sorting domain-containing protein [Planctomycetota bacterium]|nr:MAG: PEP-CTERM sorting domain-containing protein [Planctomycetota bacterium]REK42316.1 MAG: PEP-CTERM sorting domain-containing protein [Planctomycetota bacterium]
MAYMRKRFASFAGVVALTAIVLLPGSLLAQATSPPISGAGCNNTSYDGGYIAGGDGGSYSGQHIQLCNDPIADGLFTEDGVTGYQYVYDVIITSGCCGTFWLGGSKGPLGTAGEFKANESAWWRATPNDPTIRGIWQRWGNNSVHDGVVGVGDSHNFFGFGGAAQVSTTAGDVWSEQDLSAVGDTVTNVWDTSVEFNPTHDWFADGSTSAAGDSIPWAADNTWHNPDEYGFSSEFMMPGTNFGSSGIQDDEGVAWQSFTTLFSGAPLALQHTIRIVAPYEPGSINWGIDAPKSGIVTGPNGAPVPQGPTSCLIGDVNCDGYVEIGADILTAFTNFTGPGSFGKVRATGDVHGPSVATTAVLGHDGDVDVSDILTIFGAFTGPPPDEGSGGLGGPAEAGDPSIPDLIYDASTGEVTLDADGSSIIGYSLQNATNSFLPAGHTPILAGVTTALTSQLEEAALAPGSGSIGLVFPTGLDLAGLQALLTVNTVSRFLGAPLVPFDLVVVSTTAPPIPEPATAVLSLVGLMGLGLMAWRRRR